MRSRLELILAAVAAGSLLLIVSRWFMVVTGMAGVDGEAIQPLVRLTPVLVAIFVLSTAGLWIYRRRLARKVFSKSKRLIDEAANWREDFAAADDRQGIAEYQEFDPGPPSEEPVLASTYNGLRAVPISARTSKLIPANGSASAQSNHVADFASFVSAKRDKLSSGRVTAPLRNDSFIPYDENPDETEIFQDGIFTRVGAEITPDVTKDITEELKPIKALTTQSPFHQLPPELPEFAGRSFELAELLTARANPDNKILGLQGLGGVGKTTLAIKLARHIAVDFPDAQIYIDLKGVSPLPTPVAEAQAQIIRAYLPTARLPENEIELNRLYQSVLGGKRVLLLLDNAANAHQVTPLLPPDGCLSIITSRQYIALPGMFATRLDSLSAVEARDLISRIVPTIGDTAARVSELCGRLPLALRLAASAMTQNPDLPFEQYALRLAGLQNLENPMRSPMKPIDAVLTTSYELLPAYLRQLWRQLAVFTDTFDTAAAASAWKVNPARANEILNKLMACSLIERNRATGRFRLHDLMMHFADGCLTEEERAAAKHAHSAHYQSVLHEADALYEQGGQYLKKGLDLLDLEWHNIQAGQVWAATNMEESRAARELCNSYPDAGKYVLDLRQHPRERIRWSEAALAAANRLKRRKASGRHMIALGDSYLDLSETHHAIDFYEQALELAKSIGDLRIEAEALSGLGTAYYLSGAVTRSREFHESSLAIARSIGDHRSEAIALGNLGIASFALGDTRSATALFDQQLNLARQIGDRRNESSALGGLGTAHYALGNTDLSIELLEEQLQITREIGDRRGEAGALANLGNAYCSIDNHEHAIKLQEQSLSIAREIGDRRNEVNALGGLGVAYFCGGDIEVASQFIELQLELAVEIGDRRSESIAQTNLGEACLAAGNARRSIELLQQAFNITSQIGDIYGQANSLFKLAQALEKYGDHKQAIAQAETALELFEIAEHPGAEAVRGQLESWRQQKVAYSKAS